MLRFGDWGLGFIRDFEQSGVVPACVAPVHYDVQTHNDVLEQAGNLRTYLNIYFYVKYTKPIEAW